MSKKIESIAFGLSALIIIIIAFNLFTAFSISNGILVQNTQLQSLKTVFFGQSTASSSASTSSSASASASSNTSNIKSLEFNDVFPKGKPRIYASELKVSYDEIIPSLDVIANLDPAYGKNKVQLNAEEMKRYIKILTTPTITCEFCCGAKTAVTSNGKPACGCKHSQGMRGLTAYLIKNHPSEFSDDQIMQEVARWKFLFFPKQMYSRLVEEVNSQKFTPDIAAFLLDRDLTGVKVPSASDVKNLPGMVGGC